jgi:hypothetical protein
MPPSTRRPEHDESDGGRDRWCGVEQPVEQGADVQVSDAVRRVAGAGEHVMPLQDLLEDDAVREAAEPH